MTKQHHQGLGRRTPPLATEATQPGDPGAASSKLAITSPRSAPGIHIRDFIPDAFIANMDAVSRKRALTERESVALERAIKTGRVSKREAARIGMKRDMSVYSNGGR